jgi:hypothetical protein
MDPIAGRPQRTVLESCIIAKLTTHPGVAAVNLCGYYCAVRGVHPLAGPALGPRTRRCIAWNINIRILGYTKRGKLLTGNYLQK